MADVRSGRVRRPRRGEPRRQSEADGAATLPFREKEAGLAAAPLFSFALRLAEQSFLPPLRSPCSLCVTSGPLPPPGRGAASIRRKLASACRIKRVWRERSAVSRIALFFSVRVWGRFWRACARRPQWAPSRCALVSPSPAGLRRELLGAARGDDSAAKTLTPRRRPPFSVDPGFASGEWPILERSRGTFREVGGSPANAEPKRRLKKYITDKRVFCRVLKYRA